MHNFAFFGVCIAGGLSFTVNNQLVDLGQQSLMYFEYRFIFIFRLVLHKGFSRPRQQRDGFSKFDFEIAIHL